jgi:clathrin heavy chain
VFDLDSKKKLKQCEIKEAIVFWRWLSATKIAVVGAVSVYHIDVTTADTTPTKMFDRAQNLASSQIMSYQVDPTEQWCLLVGISSADGKNINGNMQLYMVDKKQQQLLEGFAGCFTQLPVGDVGGYENSVLCFIEKKAAEATTKVHVMEIGNPQAGAAKFRKSADIGYPPEAGADFPVVLHCCNKYGMLFMLTKGGYLHVIEVATCQVLYR